MKNFRKSLAISALTTAMLFGTTTVSLAETDNKVREMDGREIQQTENTVQETALTGIDFDLYSLYKSVLDFIKG